MAEQLGRGVRVVATERIAEAARALRRQPRDHLLVALEHSAIYGHGVTPGSRSEGGIIEAMLRRGAGKEERLLEEAHVRMRVREDASRVGVEFTARGPGPGSNEEGV